MKRLLNIESRKILHYNTFWIFLAVYSVLLFLVFFGAGGFKFQFKSLSFPLESLAIYDFQNIWHNLCYMASYFHWILGILIIILVTNEISYQTIRQHVIEGLSRAQVLGSKILVNILLSIGATLFILLVGLGIGAVYSSEVQLDMIFYNTDFLVGFSVQLLGYLSLALFIAVLVQRNGLSIIFYALYMLAIEPIIRYQLIEEVGQYLPAKAITGVIGNPYANMLGGQVAISPFGLNFNLTIIYTLLFWGLSYLILWRRDL